MIDLRVMKWGQSGARSVWKCILGFERGGELYLYLHDQIGSVRDIVGYNSTASQWEVLQSYDYKENGEKTIALDGGLANSKTWVGGLSVQDETADTDLYLMGHRWYSASAGGRFLSRDPIGFDGGPNLYPDVSPSPSPGPSPSPELPCDDPYEEDPKGKLYRHPGGTESTGRLQNEADKGFAMYGVPGPSVTTKPMPTWGSDYSVSTKATLEAAGFAVVKTGGAFHYTVNLRSYPEVTPDVRKRFNIAFGRRP